MLYLRPLSPSDGENVYQMLTDIEKDDCGFHNPAADMTYAQFRAWLARESAVNAGALEPGMVPQSDFWLMDGDRPVGWGRLRHRLNENLEKTSGHIGYALAASARGRGLGVQLLALLLQKAWDMGICPAQIGTRADNGASNHIIRALGGTLYRRAGDKNIYHIYPPRAGGAPVQLGMPTLVELEDLEQNARLCRALGLSFVEINMNLPIYSCGRLTEGMLRPRDGVYYTLHLDENLNPFDFNPLVAEAYMKTAEEAVGLAARAGVPVVNMHMPQGVHFKLPGKKVYLFDAYAREFTGALLRFRDRVQAAAGGAVRVCVENTTFTGFPGLTGALDALLECPAFALTYDAGHDACDGFAARPFYEARRDRVMHAHAHQSDLNTCHLPLDEGALHPNDLMPPGARPLRAVIEVKDARGLRQSVHFQKERSLWV